MDKILFVTMLYDFYGELLTEKQKSVIELHFLNDLSLNEVGEQFGITRQAVYDIIKRTISVLEQYEKKLKLYEKYNIQKEKLNNIISEFDDFGKKYKLTDANDFMDLKKAFSDILD